MKALFPSIGYERLRMGTDGEGVTTLVCAAGCPLRCAYCINPESSVKKRKPKHIFTPESLYDTVKIDSLYFLATEGGVTFGGGEPLCYSRFIEEFANLARGWKINAETSLWVAQDSVRTAAKVVDTFFVDVKDMDPKIYKAYTKRDNSRVIENLRLLADLVPSDRVVIRLPLIKDYNGDSDRDKSEAELRKMGFTRFDRFDYVIK